MWADRWSAIVVACLTSVLPTVVTAVDDQAQRWTNMNANTIWGPNDTITGPRYRAMRGHIELKSAPAEATLSIFADSRYVLWVNGTYVARGPSRFDPKGPEFDTHTVSALLNRGRNTIAVLVLAGVSNGKTMHHAPGLAVRVDALLPDGSRVNFRSDSSWRTMERTRYQPPRVGWGSVSDVIDARVDKMEWIDPGFDDSDWTRAARTENVEWGPILPRRIPLLREESLTPAPMSGASLPVQLKAGESVVFDIGRMAQGFEIVDLLADSGIELTVEHFQRLVDGEPKESYGAITRYTARAGEQQCMPIDSFGCRYLKFTAANGPVRIDRVLFVDRGYPFAHVGSFESSDDFLNDLWKRSTRTLQLTSDDGYMDCALRERAEWMGDAAVVQYPVSRVVFAGPELPHRSDARLIKGMIRRIAQSQLPDGRLKAHHPSDRFDIHAYIEDYSCLWVQTLREVYEHTGDAEIVRDVWPALVKQMELLLSTRQANGLVLGREFVIFDNPLKYKVCQGATLNAFVYRALLDSASMGDLLGEHDTAVRYRQAATDLRDAFNRVLWDESTHTYHAGVMEDGSLHAPTAHAALLALDRGIVPEARVAGVRSWLLDNYRKPGGIDFPYTYFWMFRQLYAVDTPERDVEAIQQMRSKWKHMMSRTDTGTLIESFGGGEACHNFGASPAYFLSAYVLGVRLDGPASDRHLLIEPRLGDLTNARGTVVTELGLVEVEWEHTRNGLSFSVTVPPGATASLRLPVTTPDSITINGNPTPARRQGRWTLVPIGPGAHRGQASRD